MADARQDTWIDYDEFRFRAESIEAGIKLALVICTAGLAYVAATWDQQNRELIGILFGIGAALTLPFMLMTHERVTHSRFRELFFLGWSASNIGLAAAVTYLDGGSTSPFALLFFIPLIFASLAYPLLRSSRSGCSTTSPTCSSASPPEKRTPPTSASLPFASLPPRCCAAGTPATRTAGGKCSPTSHAPTRSPAA